MQIKKKTSEMLLPVAKDTCLLKRNGDIESGKCIRDHENSAA
jgi:hypothetical protein